MAITQHIDLNLIPNSAPVVVHVDQYDHGTGRIIASLYEDSTPYTPSAASVYVQGTKPDGKFFVSSDGVTLEGNVVTADLTEVMTQVAGQVRVQFVVTEQTGRTGTFVFWLDVQASALPDDSQMSESDISMVEEAIETMQEYVSDSAESAQEAAASATASSQSAEDSEAWAVGTRNGEPVSPDDPTYHNNSKYWAEHGGGGGGHVIMNSEGEDMPARGALQFLGMNVRDDATHGITVVEGGSGGSTIKVHTSEASLAGEDVTLTDGTDTMTETFDENGDAMFMGVTMTGTLTISSTDGTDTASGTVSVPYFGVYSQNISFWSATIQVSTTTSIFDGLTVYAKKNGTVYGSAVFSNGSASITVPEAGTYTLEVTYDWKTYQSDAVNVSAETTYSVTFNGFAETVNVIGDSAFANLPITISCSGMPTQTKQLDANAELSYLALQPGTYTFSVEYQGTPYSVQQVVTSGGPFTVQLQRWTATLQFSTTSSGMDGQRIYVSLNGSVIGSAVFSNGSASLDVHGTGTYDISCTVSGFTYTDQVAVSQETTYNVTLNTFDATVNISTSSSELYGATITIKKDGANYATTNFNNSGSASYVIHETGTYTFSVEYQGQTYSDEVAVTSQTTYTAAINTFNVTITAGASVLEGETLTATNGTDTETATITNGEAKFRLAAGDWEVAGIPLTIEAGHTYEERIVVFAYHYSETDSDPASGDYPTGYDNTGWTPLAMDLSSTGAPTYNSWDPEGTNKDILKWFYPKSCMVKYDGTVDYYLDEDDETKKADGTASDVASSAYGGNAMIEWGQDGKRIYWKIVPDSGNDGWTFKISNAEVLGLKPWNHYDINGKPNRHWYEAKYFGSSDGTRLRSISGGSNYVNNAGTTEISLAEANNLTTNKLWTTGTFVDYMFFALAASMITKNLNCQAALGAGRSASGNTSAIGQGTMNGKGRFYGKSNGTEGVKVFGVENPYGNLWRRIRGLININGSYRIKMTYDQTDGSTTDGYNTDGSGYINAGSIGTTATWVYPKHDIVRDNCLLAQTNGGSETTYYCDGTYLAASGTFYALVGGHWSVAGLVGLFNVRLDNAVSDTSTYFGAALSLKPLAA